MTDVDPGVPPGLIDPVAEYDHDEGIAIIGGFVYRGQSLGELAYAGVVRRRSMTPAARVQFV